jgi:hypothetical protein
LPVRFRTFSSLEAKCYFSAKSLLRSSGRW